MTQKLSGFCVQAGAAARQHGPREGMAFHRRCQDARCVCTCHVQQTPIADRIAEAKKAKLRAAGIDPEAGPRRAKERGYCRHNHEMTPKNTGPRGECRACKRISSARCKAARKKES